VPLLPPVAGVLLVLASVAACGGSDEPPAPAAAPAPSTPASEPQTREISVPWRLAGADGTLLEIRVAGGGCVSFQNVDVRETARTVTIKAVAVQDVTPGVVCSAEVTTEQAPTALQRPLGKRKLVHAPVDEAWPGPDSLGPDVTS
jgi:hypothetical protein